MKPKHANSLFIILLTIVSFFYGYHHIIFKEPQSIHKWRQADCASIALNYYQNGMNFFAPETHNLTSDGGTSGKCMTSEIPILYYAVAVLYKIFGQHDFIFRLLNSMIFLLGLFYLFKTLMLFSKDFFWSAGLSLLIFTSPILIYYGNNFLSNSSAFAFSLIGWYLFSRFLLEHQPRFFYFSILLFFIAGAFKVTALFGLLAITTIYLFEIWKIKHPKDLSTLFQKQRMFILPVGLVLLLTGGWLVYANQFNKLHQCNYFSTTIFPIWNYNFEEIAKILSQIYKGWGNQYFHTSIFLFLGLCLFFIFSHPAKNKAFLLWSIPILFLGEFGYFLLQFWTFRDHDYYTIDMFILPVIILITGIDTLKRNHEKWINSIWIKTIFALLLIFNLNYGREKIQVRYSTKYNDKEKYEDLYSITPYLRSIGLSATDSIISVPDESHVSLYLMNQKGWTEYTDQQFNRSKAYHYNNDSLSILQSIKRGAKYVIVNGIWELYKKPYLQDFCTDLYGKYRNVLIFKLNSNKQNFKLQKRQIKKGYYCTAENLTADSLFFINADNNLFEYGKTQSDEFSHSGQYSCKLNKVNPFGMTIKLKNLKAGESIRISVWRKNQNNKNDGVLIASSKDFYNSNFKTTEKDSDNWQKIEKEFLITDELEGKELSIYLYHSGGNPVWFDDFSITLYKSFHFEKTNDNINLTTKNQIF